MININDKNRDLIENEIYLPMLITILERDKKIIEQGAFKLKNPYLDLLDRILKEINKDLKASRGYLRKNNIKILKGSSDEYFTQYTFILNGKPEEYKYFNPRLKNRSEELLTEYFNKPLSN